MSSRPRDARLEIELEPGLVLIAEHLRDGRVALGSLRSDDRGNGSPGDLTVLGKREALALAGWLATVVEDGWVGTVRDRAIQIRRTAHELYGDEPDAEQRLAANMIAEIPASLLRRALVLLVNAIGPAARERLVSRLNHTADFSEEAMLRRRVAEEQEAFGYAIAAAALYDLIDRRDEGTEEGLDRTAL